MSILVSIVVLVSRRRRLSWALVAPPRFPVSDSLEQIPSQIEDLSSIVVQFSGRVVCVFPKSSRENYKLVASIPSRFDQNILEISGFKKADQKPSFFLGKTPSQERSESFCVQEFPVRSLPRKFSIISAKIRITYELHFLVFTTFSEVLVCSRVLSILSAPSEFSGA